MAAGWWQRWLLVFGTAQQPAFDWPQLLVLAVAVVLGMVLVLAVHLLLAMALVPAIGAVQQAVGHVLWPVVCCQEQGSCQSNATVASMEGLPRGSHIVDGRVGLTIHG